VSTSPSAPTLGAADAAAKHPMARFGRIEVVPSGQNDAPPSSGPAKVAPWERETAKETRLYVDCTPVSR
jgi:hypothetical protein